MTKIYSVLIGLVLFCSIGIEMSHAEQNRSQKLTELTSYAMHLKEIGPAPLVANTPKQYKSSARTDWSNGGL